MENNAKSFVRMITSLMLVLIMIWLLFTFFLGIKMAPNDDMNPTITAEDVVVFYRMDKTPVSKDIIVVNKNDTDYIGRVVGFPGDEIDIPKKGGLFVNGYQVFDDTIFYDTTQYEGFVDYPVKLGSDEYFVLVDKREGGEDSRYYGAVRQSEIKGTVIGLFRKYR